MDHISALETVSVSIIRDCWDKQCLSTSVTLPEVEIHFNFTELLVSQSL
jgi:hypothetical protein